MWKDGVLKYPDVRMALILSFLLFTAEKKGSGRKSFLIFVSLIIKYKYINIWVNRTESVAEMRVS